jgi:hypothetical protein
MNAAKVNYGIGISIVAFVSVIIFMVVIALDKSQKQKSSGAIYIKVHNPSSTQKMVVINGQSTIMNAGCDTIQTIVAVGDNIKSQTLNLDKTVTTNIYQIPENDQTKPLTDIFLTDAGIYTNLSIIKGRLINDSADPVIFIERGDLERRWAKHLVFPGQEVDNVILGIGSVWEVTSPERDNIELSTVKVSPESKILKYDGESLTSI